MHYLGWKWREGSRRVTRHVLTPVCVSAVLESCYEESRAVSAAWETFSTALEFVLQSSVDTRPRRDIS